MPSLRIPGFSCVKRMCVRRDHPNIPTMLEFADRPHYLFSNVLEAKRK